MSYTMTLDMPQETAAFINRGGARFREELNALFVAIVTTKMRYAPDASEMDETPGPALLASFKESDEMEAGLRPRQDFKTVDELMADCLA